MQAAIDDDWDESEGADSAATDTVDRWLRQAFEAERAPRRPATPLARRDTGFAAARRYYWCMLVLSLVSLALRALPA